MSSGSLREVFHCFWGAWVCARAAGPNTVVFVDGTRFEADVIICCTGFAITFPFLEPWNPQLAAEVCNARYAPVLVLAICFLHLFVD